MIFHHPAAQKQPLKHEKVRQKERLTKGLGQSRNGGNRREGEIFTNKRYRVSAAFQLLRRPLYTLHQKGTWAVPHSPWSEGERT